MDNDPSRMTVRELCDLYGDAHRHLSTLGEVIDARAAVVAELERRCSLPPPPPADEAEPVTVEQMKSLGACHGGGCQWTIRGPKDWTVTFFDDGPGELFIKAGKLCDSPTMGRLRHTLAALGITPARPDTPEGG